MPLFRGRGHHLAARTDAEGEGAPAIRQVTGQLIIAWRQKRKSVAELGSADVFLPVFDTHAHCKGLLCQNNPGAQQHPDGIPCGMARSQDERVAGQ
ncbi:hypothetical protein SDC9_140014 [bioreactor metagenome]|uniref:Uncharacterized protein n=1 Tax=bioreactor metagenome TaxID=1076179 RepID=A0A645DUR9_9ZZZZ